MAQKEFERGAGILMHISSIPSPYGIGSFGKNAYEFVDRLVAARQKYWQVLPLGTTSYGDSHTLLFLRLQVILILSIWIH